MAPGDPTDPGRAGPAAQGSDPRGGGREARLKAALKANIARRKAQARSRADDSAPGGDTAPPGAHTAED